MSSESVRSKVYEGIHNDRYGGMTHTGSIIKDAWIYGVLPETETCEGWTIARLDALYGEVEAARQQHGYTVRELPPEIRERHERIHREAIARARDLGWDADRDISGEP
jgi:hypothetical protein